MTAGECLTDIKVHILYHYMYHIIITQYYTVPIHVVRYTKYVLYDLMKNKTQKLQYNYNSDMYTIKKNIKKQLKIRNN